jgi:hypothetical protein
MYEQSSTSSVATSISIGESTMMMVLRVFFTLLLCTQFALGHGNLSHRHAVGTLRTLVDGSRSLDLMFTLSLVGPRAKMISARFDLNRDGDFSSQETELIAQELQKEMLGGMELQCHPTQSLRSTKTLYKAHKKGGRSLVVAALITYPLPETCSPLIFGVRPGSQRKGLEHIKLRLNAYPPLSLDQAQYVEFQLMPGDSKQILVSKSQTL